MTNPYRFRVTSVISAVLLLVLAGCASTEPSRYYTLGPLPELATEEQTTSARQSLAIGLGPIELPAYLDRPQIVTRTGANQLKIAEFDRWAEPLEQNFARVLAENLSTLLSTDRVFTYPWKRSTPIRYKVTIDVIRFDGQPGGSVTLVARWTISGMDEQEELSQRKSSISVPADGDDYNVLVSAKSRALAHLSSEIAATIEAVSQHQPDD
ncbi:MAG: membrane integrity-associated transporter subunit PqiC [Candidatus Hydrogenedentota bacterium]|nr:MAG: membrane integrity-associated transporter subunit PqiC [Candidatus Hydrogenedentota bacterium]